MSTAAQHVMPGIEQRRQELQENVDKLSKALEHWSAWETEYSMLKEELQAAGSPSTADIMELGRELNGTLVNEKEVEELLGKTLQAKRIANQVIDMISRRIDYVQQNRSTVEKQLETAEKQLAGVSMLSDPGLEDEEGLPIMDIEEELDDDENVVSSSVSQPGKVAPELVEALRKAGLHKAERTEATEAQTAPKHPPSAASDPLVRPSVPTKASVSTSEPSSTLGTAAKPSSVRAAVRVDSKLSTSEAVPRKKSVAFAEDVQVQTFEKLTGLKGDLKNWNLKPGSRVYELDGEENVIANFTVPQDESPEDDELRREMLQYGLSEVGQVVAELNVEGDTDMDDEFDDDSDGDGDDEEDEHGRSTRAMLTDDYRRQMMELEKKLNARMVENLGPRPDRHPLPDSVDDVRTLRVRKDENFDEPIEDSEQLLSDTNKQRKGVRFADAFDISAVPEAAKGELHAASVPVPTMLDTVVERSRPSSQSPAAPSKPGKVSRFKSSRAAATQPPTMLPTPLVPEQSPLPTGPANRALANTIIEHSPQVFEPQAPDGFDSAVINREVSTEYHKLRNKMIQQQGGFKPTEDNEEEDPIVEHKDGQTRKVSRFKAARLKADGL